jgi:hypothetical protein
VVANTSSALCKDQKGKKNVGSGENDCIGRRFVKKLIEKMDCKTANNKNSKRQDPSKAEHSAIGVGMARHESSAAAH